MRHTIRYSATMHDSGDVPVQVALDVIKEWIGFEDNEANQNYLELLYEEIEDRAQAEKECK